MKYMYLVQSGKFAPLNIFYENNGDGALRDLSKLIRFHYMGHAEFEWGNVPASIRRIVSNGKYEIKKSKIASVRGVPLWIVSSESTSFEEAEETIDAYLKSCDPNKIRTYRLKDSICLEYYVHPWYSSHNWNFQFDRIYKGSKVVGYSGQHENFWIDIKNDFMFFLGAEDRVSAMKLALENSRLCYEAKENSNR